MPRDSTVEQFLGLILHTAVVVMLLLFALNFSIKAGERGLFPHDQSIMLDGAHRIISGQSPYRDFVMPFTPMSFWVQAVFSRICGFNHFSCVVSAAVVNIFATLFSVLIARQLFPNRRFISYLAGLITAIWFSPPFGTLWMDQVAFLFALFALLMTLYGLPIEEKGPTADLLFVLSGCAAFLSFASKQNIGFFMLPLCPVVLMVGLAPHRRRMFVAIGLFIAGVAGASLAFLVWLYVASSPSTFWEYSIRMASRLGVTRLFGNVWGLILTMLFGRGPFFNRAVTTAFLILSVFMLSFHFRDRRLTGYSSSRLFLPPLICVYLVLCQRLCIHTTMNQPQNGYPFIGLIVASGTGILLYLFQSENPRIKQLIDRLQPLTRRDARTMLAAAVILSSIYVSISGVSVSLNRDVQDSVAGSSFPKRLTHPGLLSLRWGSPTMIADRDVSERDIVNILTYLNESKKNFFIFPDFSIFYGLVGVPSPQPLLYFARGETYPATGQNSADSLVVNGLKENGVEIAVLEERSVSGTDEVLNDFPLLKAYLEESFIKVGKMGIFHIHRKPEYGFEPMGKEWIPAI